MNVTRLGLFRRKVSKTWRRIRTLPNPSRHSCLKCGFLSSHKGHEVNQEERSRIAAKGKAGWFQPEDPFCCAKELWQTELGGGADLIFFEANRKRAYCAGFHTWVRGRDIAAHLKIEDEERTFRHESRLAWRSFWGALIGALIGAIVGLLMRFI